MPDGLAELAWRLRHAEQNIEDVKTEFRSEIAEVKKEIKGTKDEITLSQKGMSRPEKIAVSMAILAAIGTVITVIALLQGAPA